ncbi:MAG: hypothetical protein ACP5JJ_16265, partial [Anaerolineae bacterium]
MRALWGVVAKLPHMQDFYLAGGTALALRLGHRLSGLMKLDAIAGRGTRKDFYDLYFIAAHVSLDVLFARSKEKYPHSHSFGMRVLTALVDFDIAEKDCPPRTRQQLKPK